MGSVVIIFITLVIIISGKLTYDLETTVLILDLKETSRQALSSTSNHLITKLKGFNLTSTERRVMCRVIMSVMVNEEQWRFQCLVFTDDLKMLGHWNRTHALETHHQGNATMPSKNKCIHLPNTFKRGACTLCYIMHFFCLLFLIDILSSKMSSLINRTFCNDDMKTRSQFLANNSNFSETWISFFSFSLLK